MHHSSSSIMLVASRLCVQLERAHAITMHLRSREFPTYLAQAEAARVLAELERLAQLQLSSNAALGLIDATFPDHLVGPSGARCRQVLAVLTAQASCTGMTWPLLVRCCDKKSIPLNPLQQ